MFMTLPNDSEIQLMTCIKRNAMERKQELSFKLVVQTM